MKIAIKTHPSRGKEIISLLESLGGINVNNWKGDGVLDTYYIGEDNRIIYDPAPKGYKVYTLEEFETEFPFKIGDKVRHISSIGTIRKYCYIDNKPGYEVESMELGIIANIPAEILEPYEEMKEERNITLTLDKAKEWYKKGGELKEVALQAYSEEELVKVKLPKTWEEFCKNYPKQQHETYIGIFSTIESYTSISDRHHIQDKNLCTSKKSAEAHLALIQLEQLRDCYRQGDIPDFTKGIHKYCIAKINKRIDVVESAFTSYFLSFTKKEVAEEFLKCFRDLIEIAGDLI